MRLRELPPTAGLVPHLADLCRVAPAPFEEALAKWLGVPGVQVECSGTASLYVALEYLKTRSAATEVIVPAFTCPLVALAVRKAGLTVTVCDTAARSFEFHLERLPSMLGANTLCVIATHWGGALSDVGALTTVVRSVAPQVYVVEDCAQAFGGTVGGRSVGLQGDLGFFSFAAGKGLSLYEGGCLVSRDAEIRSGLARASARLVPAQPLVEARRTLELLGLHLLYRPLGLYFAYGMPRRYWMKRGNFGKALRDEQTEIPLHGVSAWRKRVGTQLLKRMRSHLAGSRATFERMRLALANVPRIHIHESPRGAIPPCSYLMLTLETAEQASWLLAAAAPLGLGVSRLFAYTLDRYEHLSGIVGPSDTRHATDLAARTITLTTSGYMRDSEREAVVELVRAAAERPRGLAREC
jgi:dTDP-4-amino-4,6-dideoxygalactose transaminase